MCAGSMLLRSQQSTIEHDISVIVDMLFMPHRVIAYMHRVIISLGSGALIDLAVVGSALQLMRR